MDKSKTECDHGIELLISQIRQLNTEEDRAVIKRLNKTLADAFAPRKFYIIDLKLDYDKNNGEIVLKTGYTRNTIESRFNDKRNGYLRVETIHREWDLPPSLSEKLNKHINDKYACGKCGAKYNFTGKTEVIDTDLHDIDTIISECERFIEQYKYFLTGRGKIN